MNKYPLIGGSIITTMLIIFSSLNNIVGYQTVQASNQKIINTEVNQRELLFHIIIKIANNREIQKVARGSELTGKKFFNADIRYSVFNPLVITEKSLKHAYAMSAVICRIFGKSMIYSMLEKYKANNQGMQKQIIASIEKDGELKKEMMQLSTSSCDCNKENSTRLWNFPIICTLLAPLYVFSVFLLTVFEIDYPWTFILAIAGELNCYWLP